MSQQIGPWSTHEKYFRAPLRRKKAHSTFKRLIPSNQSIQIPKAGKEQRVKTYSISKKIERSEQHLQQPTPFIQKEAQISQDYLKTSTQIVKMLEQRFVLAVVRQELIKCQSISILLPFLQQKSTNGSIPIPKVKKYSFQTQTINTVYPKYQRNRSQIRQKILQKIPDKPSNSKIVEQDPFNDRKILKRADALLKNYKQWREQYQFSIVKVKRK